MEMPTLDKFPRKVLADIDAERAFIISRLIVAAERLQVFRTLHGKRMKAPAIGRALKIHKFYRDIFLNSLVSLRLSHKAGDTYWNTRFAKNTSLKSVRFTGRGNTQTNACRPARILPVRGAHTRSWAVRRLQLEPDGGG
jgi:Dimerisation domain